MDNLNVDCKRGYFKSYPSGKRNNKGTVKFINICSYCVPKPQDVNISFLSLALTVVTESML